MFYARAHVFRNILKKSIRKFKCFTFPNVVLDPTDFDSKYGLKQLKHSSPMFQEHQCWQTVHFGWTIPLTGLLVPLQERPQSSQLAVQWSAWFLAGWKSASESESSSCGEGGERANCLGRISTLPLLRSEMKGDDVWLFPHSITQCSSQCFSCSIRKPDKNNMPQWHPQDYIYLENPQEEKHFLSAYSHLQFNAPKDQCLFTSSRLYDNLEDRQECFFSPEGT